MLKVNVTPRRGDIFLAEMCQSKGSEQSRIRPVVIVQNDVGNRYSPTTIIVPLTSRKKRSLPTHVRIKHTELKYSSTALCDQVTTISVLRLLKYIGSLDEKEMKKIDKSLGTSLDFRRK